MRILLSMVLVCGVLVLAGALLARTGAKGTGYERYIPSEDTAREALTAVLQAWQQGQGGEHLTDRLPTVEVVDSHRRPGQKLQGYAILGPVPGDSPRCFAVRLVLDAPHEEVKVRYVVLGLDPLWVMRYDDYEMMAHMDHPIPPRLPSPRRSFSGGS
jgi:hypothetical protein